jgi:hypothetical protein
MKHENSGIHTAAVYDQTRYIVKTTKIVLKHVLHTKLTQTVKLPPLVCQRDHRGERLVVVPKVEVSIEDMDAEVRVFGSVGQD